MQQLIKSNDHEEIMVIALAPQSAGDPACNKVNQEMCRPIRYPPQHQHSPKLTLNSEYQVEGSSGADDHGDIVDRDVGKQGFHVLALVGRHPMRLKDEIRYPMRYQYC